MLGVLGAKSFFDISAPLNLVINRRAAEGFLMSPQFCGKGRRESFKADRMLLSVRAKFSTGKSDCFHGKRRTADFRCSCSELIRRVGKRTLVTKISEGSF